LLKGFDQREVIPPLLALENLIALTLKRGDAFQGLSQSLAVPRTFPNLICNPKVRPAIQKIIYNVDTLS
jgi:hypothetical protein